MSSTRPRVLVTGGSGVFGLGTARWLDRLGMTPVLMARRPMDAVPFGAEFVAGDVTKPEDVGRAVEGVHSVIHLAWTVSALASDEVARAIDLDGTRNLLAAIADAGVRRLVFASSITAYGAHPDHPQPYTEDEPLRPSERFRYEVHKAEAERMISNADLESVLVRPTVVVGRSARNNVTDVFSQPVLAMPPGEVTMQFVHQDDVGRFFASVALEGPTGPVNLVAEDPVPISELPGLLGRSLVQPPMGVMRRLAAVSKATKFMEGDPELLDLFLHFPKGDPTRLREEFGFQTAYSSREALADFGRSIRNQRVIGRWRGTKLRALADHDVNPFVATDAAGESLRVVPDAVAGEFDDIDVDPAYPAWTGANVGEAYPAPMTALGLELAVDMMRAAGPVVLDFIGSVDEATDHAIRHKFVASMGHGVRVNLTLLRKVNDAVPGQTPEQFENAILGTPLPEGFSPAKPRLSEVPALLGVVARTAPKLLGMERQVDELVARSATVADRVADLASRPDEVVMARIDQLWDETVKDWITTGGTTFMVSVPQSVVERVMGLGALAEISTGDSELMSVGPLRGVSQMLDEAEPVPGLLQDLRDAPAKDRVDLLRNRAPRVAAVLDRMVLDFGHRGPGEMELANGTYADRPELLVEAMLHRRLERAATSRPVSELSGLERRLVARAHAAMARRERARDATSRMIQALRRALREWGQRLVERGDIDTVDDVFHLRRQELLHPPVDARAVIARRREERERLRGVPFPITFDGPWAPADAATGEDGAITGLGASAGTVTGKVRVMLSPTDHFEIGEVLVTKVTDVGWTPLFGAAAAVVTDMGAAMSHAAIVAREFGIPAVVSARDASHRLTTGQVVEVDGTAGTVTVVRAT